MFKRKTAGKEIDRAVKKAVDFEVTIADLARRSERRAWRVAGASLLMSFALAGGLFYLMPHLQKREPYLIMADPYAGTATLARLSSGSEFADMKASEAVNRSNIVHYVLARESYDGGAINERDRRTVYTMSDQKVRGQLNAERSPDNPESNAAKYQDRAAVRIRILSVTPLGASPGKPPTSATVRFQRLLFDKSSGITTVLDNKLATMEFHYAPDIKMNDADSAENPLRFQVSNYRVDDDAATVVPTQLVPRSAIAPEIPSMAPADAASPAVPAPTPATPTAPGAATPAPAAAPAAAPAPPAATPAAGTRSPQ